jgi:hypothetical protein
MSESVETWKDIVNFPGYAVSSLGRIFSAKSNKILSFNQKVRYQLVILHSDGLRFTRTVHRLVMESFELRPSVKGRWQVNHKNGNRHDNRLENLEWVTPSQNAQHAVDTGIMNNRRKLMSERFSGVNNPNAKLTSENVQYIIDSKESRSELAKRFGVTSATIHYTLIKYKKVPDVAV